jgi:hypothetical protein
MRPSQLVRWRAGKAPPTRLRKRLALGIALLADLIQLVFAPLFGEGALSPLDDALDVAVAITLTALLGWRWRTALALAAELVPGLALFPTWTALVATLPAVPQPVDAERLLEVTPKGQ